MTFSMSLYSFGRRTAPTITALLEFSCSCMDRSMVMSSRMVRIQISVGSVLVRVLSLPVCQEYRRTFDIDIVTDSGFFITMHKNQRIPVPPLLTNS